MDLKKIDPNAQYRVELKDKAELFGQVFYPGHDLTLRGDVAKSIADKVERATRIDPPEA